MEATFVNNDSRDCRDNTVACAWIVIVVVTKRHFSLLLQEYHSRAFTLRTRCASADVREAPATKPALENEGCGTREKPASSCESVDTSRKSPRVKPTRGPPTKTALERRFVT